MGKNTPRHVCLFAVRLLYCLLSSSCSRSRCCSHSHHSRNRPSTPADQTDPTGQEAQTGEKNSVLPVVAVVAAVLLGGGVFYFIKRRR